MLFDVVVFFFFKQKTAYEMRISDWSSDVCSSDLVEGEAAAGLPAAARQSRRSDAVAADEARQGRQESPVPRPRPCAQGQAERQAARDRRPSAARADSACRIASRCRDSSAVAGQGRSEEHTSELQSLMSNSYDVFCL